MVTTTAVHTIPPRLPPNNQQQAVSCHCWGSALFCTARATQRFPHLAADPPCATVNGARDGASLPREVVGEVEGVQAEKGAPCYFADATVCYLGKDSVPEFIAQRRANTCNAV